MRNRNITKTLHRSLKRSILALQPLEDRRVLAVTVDFEDVGTSLAAQASFNGPVPGGATGTGPFGDAVVIGEFQSQGATFNNTYSLDFGSWSGWAYSNITDNTTAGFGNQFSAYPGGGANGSATYGIGFDDAAIVLPAVPAGLEFDSLQISNTTYAALSMRDGDSFAKKFGGLSGNDPDYFLVTIEGLSAGGVPVGTVDVYLADYRDSDNALDYIVDSWLTVDLSSLSGAVSLAFHVDSSDVGPFGINTPSFFAVDNIVLEEPSVPQITASAGGPYSIAEGMSLTLQGSSQNAASPVYQWDLNGDGTSDATGPSPTLAWQQLTALGLADGSLLGTAHQVSLTVASDGMTATDSATLTILNVAPTASIAGAGSGMPGEMLTFLLSAADASPVDATGTFIYQIDWGDGTAPAQVTGSASGVTVTHAFADPDSYTVSVTAEDQDGGVSTAATRTVSVQSIVQEDNDLVIMGSSGNDRIVIFPGNTSPRIRLNDVTIGLTLGSATRIVVSGGGGNDSIVAAGGLDLPVVLIGGDGNDYLAGGTLGDTLLGGSGNDVLLSGEGDNFVDGGSGADRIEARAGADTLFGGAGNDRLNGGPGDDLLDGGDGNDLLFGHLGNDLLKGGNGLDTLQGYYGNDVVLGGAGSDQIFGGSDQDLLIGGADPDRLRGDAGDDTLAGGHSALEAALDQALAELLTLGSPLPVAIRSALDGWFTGGNISPFSPFGSDSAFDELQGGSGLNALISS